MNIIRITTTKTAQGTHGPRLLQSGLHHHRQRIGAGGGDCLHRKAAPTATRLRSLSAPLLTKRTNLLFSAQRSVHCRHDGRLRELYGSDPVRRYRRDSNRITRKPIISNMELNIKDRLYIPVILPKDGTFKEFNTKKEILRKIEISAKEREAVGLHENEGERSHRVGHRERHAAVHRFHCRRTGLT